VAPIRMASETRSIDSSELATPFLLIEPLSAVAVANQVGVAQLESDDVVAGDAP
jgi:hypothetical protein